MQIKIYTRNHCSFCFAAKHLLAKRGIKYEEISLGDDVAAEEEMQRLTGQTAVPQILINGKPIGGFTELADIDMDGELQKLSVGDS